MLIRSHIRPEHVHLRADEGDQLLKIATRDKFELPLRKLIRVHAHAAFGPAIGQTGQGAFPAHPDGQCGGFPNRQARRKSRSALGWSNSEMVLDPVAVKNLDRAIVTRNRNGDRHRSLRIDDPFAIAFRDFEIVRNPSNCCLAI